MRFLSLALLVSLTACSVDPSASHSSSSAETPEALSQATVDALVGTYAMTAALKGSAEYPAPVGKVNTVGKLFRLAKITQNSDGKLEITENNCAGEIQSDSSFKVFSDKSNHQSATVVKTEIQVTEKDGIVSFTRPEAIQVMGVELADIKNDKLPTNEADKRLVLFPGEMHRGAKSMASFTTPKILLIPGVTIKSDIFFAARSTNTYTATLDSTTGEMAGPLSDTTEQSVVAVSNIIAAGAKGLTVVKTPADKGSVSFVKIDEAATCETVVSLLAPDQAD